MTAHVARALVTTRVVAVLMLGVLLGLGIAPHPGALAQAPGPVGAHAAAFAATTEAPSVPSGISARIGFFPPPPDLSAGTNSGSNTYFVGAQVPTSSCSSGCTYLTNSGVRGTIQVVGQPVTGCLSYWVSDDSAANIWGQIGYYICNSSTPVGFYQIWNLNTGAGLTSGTTAVSTGYHTFSMYSQNGGNGWAYALDGAVFGTYDMGSNLSMGTYPVEAVSEEGYVSTPWNPAQVWFSPAIQTLQTSLTFPIGNGWYSQSPAFEPWSGCSSGGVANNTAGYSCWGVAGTLQDSSIPGDAMAVGGPTGPVRGGTYLWNSVAADFTVTASPTSVTANAGVSATSTISVSPIGGFAGTVSLAPSVSPATGLSCTLAPTSVSGGSGSSTLSCSGSAGSYTVTVTGTSGGLSHSASVAFTVSDFTVTASPTSLAIYAGATGTSTVTVGSVNGFGGTVSLASSVSPATGLACSLSPTSVVGSGTSTLSCAGSTAGSYVVTVTGSSGSLSRSATVTVSVSSSIVLNLSFAIVGGGIGYSSPSLTYIQGGATKTAVLTLSATAYTVDANSAWSVTNPLTGSSTGERWQTSLATSGTATSVVTIVFSYYHQYFVTFAYSLLDGGSAYSAPTIAYTAFGTGGSSGTGVAVWADAASSYAYPVALTGSSSSEAWRTNTPSGTLAAPATITVVYYHQFSVTFGYTVLGGGSGYAAPTLATTQFGVSASVGTSIAAWIDAGASYAFTNPLSGSGSTERWISPSPSGTVAAAGTITASYYHQLLATFAFLVVDGGTGYSAPTVSYTSLGSPASASVGSSVWADAGSGYAFANPLPGSSSTAAWRTNAGSGYVLTAGSISAAYYYQFLVAFSVQTVNGSPPPVMPTLIATVFGGTASIVAGGSSWVDANGAYSYPASFAGATGERWMSASPDNGTVPQSETITASYYHQYNVAFAYAVSGGGSGYSAPSLTYVSLGTDLTSTAGAGVWADAGSAYVYAADLPGASSTQRWVTPVPGGTVAQPGTVTVTYIHQFWTDFTYTVKGGGSGYSAPSVTYSNLSASRDVLAVALWVWADAGAAYQYQNPLPGSTSSNSWQTNNGAGATGTSTTYSATYRHQYKVKIKTTTTAGTLTQESPLVNVTLFGTTVTMPADNVTWVDAGGSYSFPATFYGPLPGERWITATPASGLVLSPMNITAEYARQYYLAIQVNTDAGGTISASPGWYNASAATTLQASANLGWQFQGWIGSGNGSYSGSSTAASITLEAPVTETAVFYVGLTLTSRGGGSLQYAYGGTTGWVPAGDSETLYLAPGTEVAVRATPSLFHQLDGWDGAATGSASTLVLVAAAPQTLSATFGLSLYQRADSVLGLALMAMAILALVLALHRRKRKKKERALRAARLHAKTPAATWR